MLNRLACDLKFISFAGKAVLCLDAVKKVLCVALVIFAIVETVTLIFKTKCA